MKIKSKFVRKYGAEFGLMKHVQKANAAVQAALSNASRAGAALSRSKQREDMLFRELEASEQALQYMQDKLTNEQAAHADLAARMQNMLNTAERNCNSQKLELQMLLQDTAKTLKYWQLLGITGWALAAVLAALPVVGLR